MAWSFQNSGNPTAYWDYYDENGQAVVRVYRYDDDSGKRYLPFDVKKSTFTAPEIRPLYNIPGILKSDKVILVEGEKCAEALIKQGITATTIMSGANADVKKTDWSQLKGKHIIIWPDNDKAGAKYAKNVGNKLLEIGIASLAVLEIPRGKPKKWDAADCVEEGINVEKFLALTTCINLSATDILNTKRFVGFPARQYLSDKSPMPEDIIAPRVLTPSGLLVFAGAPKVGKVTFLLLGFSIWRQEFNFLIWYLKGL